MVEFHPPNPSGRDFFVGDLHGTFAALDALLAALGFVPEEDRLFSVGDLIDRGPEPDRFDAFLAQPWFHAIRGNHEQMALDACYGLRALDAETVQRFVLWERNGGGWGAGRIHGEPALVRRLVALEKLPWLMEVETVLGRVGLVHAEVPPGRDWTQLRDNLGDDAALREAAIWSRERVRSRKRKPVRGIDWVISGHTPVREPLRLGNQWFIDTGAGYDNLDWAQLTVLEAHPSGWRMHQQPT